MEGSSKHLNRRLDEMSCRTVDMMLSTARASTTLTTRVCEEEITPMFTPPRATMLYSQECVRIKLICSTSTYTEFAICEAKPLT